MKYKILIIYVYFNRIRVINNNLNDYIQNNYIYIFFLNVLMSRDTINFEVINILIDFSVAQYPS